MNRAPAPSPGKPLSTERVFRYSRGVNLAGPEYGDNGAAYDAASAPNRENPVSFTAPGVLGTDYAYPTLADLRFIASRMPDPVCRLNIRIERLQESVGGPLRATEAARIREVLDAAHEAGVGIVLAPWNFGSVWIASGTATTRHPIGSAQYPVTAFAGFWAETARGFGSHPGVSAFDLMIEPVGLPGGARGWEKAAQSALDAIREVSRSVWVWVPTYGYGLSSLSSHPARWIEDPAGRHGYKGHHYSYNLGGSQTDYDDAVASAIDQGYRAGPNADALITRELGVLAAFRAWLGEAEGYIGEYGVPQVEHPEVSPDHARKWIAYTERMLQEYDANGWSATAWTAGNVVDPAYLYSIYYPTGGWTTAVNAATSAAAVIEAHPTKRG